MTERRLPSIAPYAMPKAGEWPPPRAPWALEPGRAALLVHDMQRYFVDAFVADAPPVPELVTHIGQLLAAARAAGLPVFFTAQQGEQDRRDRGLQADLWGPGMRRTAAHQDILPALAPQAGEFVLVKHRYSAFQRSNLDTLLRARGRDQLIICGVYAHIGCLLTAGDAFQHDIEPFVAGDALGDFSRDWHDRALTQLGDCMAVVLSCQQIIKALS